MTGAKRRQMEQAGLEVIGDAGFLLLGPATSRSDKPKNESMASP